MAAQLHAEEEARARLGGLGRTKWFELIKNGEIRTVKIGRRRFVSEDALQDYVHRLEQQVA